MHLVQDVDFKNGLLGGVMIGLSASAFMYLTGKITGLSGIAEGVVSIKGEPWNYSYIAGLGTAGVIMSVVNPEAFGPASPLSTGTLLAAGLLTGFGTRLAGGCTSGHGLCGLPRLSPRSVTAVMAFMSTGAIAAHLSRLPENAAVLRTPTDESFGPLIPTVVGVVGGLYVAMNFPAIYKKLAGASAAPAKKGGPEIDNFQMHVASFGSSLLFGLGLGISGMCNPNRVIRFLDFLGAEGWDPTLASVLGGGVIVTFLSFNYFKKAKAPIALCGKNGQLCDTINVGAVPPNLVIDWKLLLGSALFGIGWGLAGMCPGPAMVVAAGGGAAALKFVPSMAAGMIAKEILLG